MSKSRQCLSRIIRHVTAPRETSLDRALRRNQKWIDEVKNCPTMGEKYGITEL